MDETDTAGCQSPPTEISQPTPSESLAPGQKLRTVWYEGFQPGTKAEVAYQIRGRQIIFSATGNRFGDAPTTVNAAERVIQQICQQEGIDWKDFEFFDLQTQRGGYARHESANTTALDRLVFDKEDKLRVTGWEPVYDTNLGIGVEADSLEKTISRLTSRNELQT